MAMGVARSSIRRRIQPLTWTHSSFLGEYRRLHRGMEKLETHFHAGGSSGPAHSASSPYGTRCVSRCEYMPCDTPIALNSLFHSMSSIICSRSLLDRYQYHPGLLGVSVIQITFQSPQPTDTAEYRESMDCRLQTLVLRIRDPKMSVMKSVVGICRNCRMPS